MVPLKLLGPLQLYVTPVEGVAVKGTFGVGHEMTPLLVTFGEGGVLSKSTATVEVLVQLFAELVTVTV